MKNYHALIVIFPLLLAGCLHLGGGNSDPQKWYEGTWNHEAGDFQLIISKTDWILKWHNRKDYDEKGRIIFNEENQTFLMRSTHYWDSNTNNWEENNQRVSGSYTIAGRRWIITDCSLDDYIGTWTKQ